MNWTQDKSVKLSQFCVSLFMVIFVLLCLLAPWGFRLFIALRGQEMGKLPLFLTTVYTSAVPAAVALLELRRMLSNIRRGKVFIQENVSALRRLSWCCFLAGGVYLLSTLYYPTYILLGAAAAFIGLILRVVKNIFAEAVEIKTENDYTI